MGRETGRLAPLAIVAMALGAGCGGGGGGGGFFDAGSFGFFDANAQGAASIITRSGDGDHDGEGDEAGSLNIQNRGGGDIRLFANGAANAAFALPGVLSPSLGTNPLILTADGTSTSIVLTPTTSTPPRLLHPVGGGEVTGLFVGSGFTLILRPNADQRDGVGDLGSDGLLDSVGVEFEDSVVIEGVLQTEFQQDTTTTFAADDASHLSIFTAESVIVAAGGSVRTLGLLSTSTSTSSGDAGDIGIEALGSIVVQGAIQAFGQAGPSGSAGGDVFLECSFFGGVYVTGSIDTSGGEGSTGSGGEGGEITLDAIDSVGGVFVSGLLDSSGGDGTNDGASGGDIFLLTDGGEEQEGITANSGFSPQPIGPVVSSGTLDSSGGDSTDGGDGGNGGDLTIMVRGGTVRLTGTIDTFGGRAAGSEDDGGDGGDVGIFGSDNNQFLGDDAPAGGFFIGATIDTQGGDGSGSDSDGGSGGDVDIRLENDSDSSIPGAHPIVLAGYVEIDLSGGDGLESGDDGGNAGSLNLVTQLTGTNDGNTQVVGGIENQVTIVAHGGNGLGQGGEGGRGAIVFIQTEGGAGFEDFTRAAVNSASIDLRGGDGDNGEGSGRGGDFHLYDYIAVFNSGAVNVSGGVGTLTTTDGGEAGFVEIASDGAVTCSGSITANGGDAGDDGGFANQNDPGLLLVSRFTTVSTVLSARGGNGTADGGGDGGHIEVLSTENASALGGSTLDAQGGTGTSDGDDGTIRVDGVLAADPALSF